MCILISISMPAQNLESLRMVCITYLKNEWNENQMLQDLGTFEIIKCVNKIIRHTAKNC